MTPDLKRSRLKLVLLAILFVAPVVASYATFYLMGPSRGDASHGRLLDPARPMFVYPQASTSKSAEGPAKPRPWLASAGLENAAGEPIDPRLFREQWTLLFIADGRCAEACRRRLYDTRQVRIATGRDRHRIERVLLMLDPAAEQELKAFLKREHRDLRLAVGGLPQAAPLVRFFSPSGEETVGEVSAAGRVYLIDPLGNWFMFYRPGQPAEGILDDLERVMRASFIG